MTKLRSMVGLTPQRDQSVESRDVGSIAELTPDVAATFGIELPAPGRLPAVTPANATTIIAVYRAINYIANQVARLPLQVRERTSEGDEHAFSHPLQRVIGLRPNPEMTAFTLWQTVISQALLWGEGYAEIVRDGRGAVKQLIPIESRLVQPFRVHGTNELRYRAWHNHRDESTVLLQRDVLRIQCMSPDGVCGISPIRHARLSLGVSKAVEEFGSGFFGNAARPSAVIQHPGKLSQQAAVNFRASVRDHYSGARNAGMPLLLEEGATWAPMSMPPEEAQFLESRKFTVLEVARLFGVPPHKLAELDNANRSTIEQQSMEVLGDTLDPWICQLEQEASFKLFSGASSADQRYFAKVNLDDLLRTDAKSRSEINHRALIDGWKNIDEVRRAEGLKKLPDGRGQTHFVAQNMMPAMTVEQAVELLTNIIASKAKGATSAPPGGESGEDGDQNT